MCFEPRRRRKARASSRTPKSVKRLALTFMVIREYSEGDLAALRSIHAAQGFEYPLPDLRNPLFVTKLVLAQDPSSESACTGTIYRDPADAAPVQQPRSTQEGSVENGSQDVAAAAPPSRILGAAFLPLTAEAYLLLDPRASLAMAPRPPRRRRTRRLATRPGRRPRLAPAVHRNKVRQTPRALRLAPRRRLDALLQKIITSEVKEINEVKEFRD